MTGQGPRTTFILERSVGKLSWVGKRSQERAEPLSCVLSSASAEAAVQRLGETQSTAACFCSFLKTDGAPLRLAVGVGIWGGCVDPAKVWAQEHKAAQMRPAAPAGRHRWWTFPLLAHVTPQPRRRSRDPHHVTPISTSDWLSAITCRRRGAGRAAAVATATGGGGGQVGRAAPVSLCCRAPSGLRFGSGGAGWGGALCGPLCCLLAPPSSCIAAEPGGAAQRWATCWLTKLSCWDWWERLVFSSVLPRSEASRAPSAALPLGSDALKTRSAIRPRVGCSHRSHGLLYGSEGHRCPRGAWKHPAATTTAKASLSSAWDCWGGGGEGWCVIQWLCVAGGGRKAADLFFRAVLSRPLVWPMRPQMWVVGSPTAVCECCCEGEGHA